MTAGATRAGLTDESQGNDAGVHFVHTAPPPHGVADQTLFPVQIFWPTIASAVL